MDNLKKVKKIVDQMEITDSYSGGETDGGYWKYGESSGLDGVPIDVMADDISAINWLL